MKRWLIAILLVAVLSLFGCGDAEKENQDNNNNVSEQEEIEGQNPNEEPQKMSEFSILFGEHEIALKDWDNEVNIEEIFGEPLEVKSEILGPNSDTFNGSFMKEITYSGIKFVMFSPKDNGKNYYILSMNIMDNSIETKRGIRVGDTLEKLNEVYPELKPVLDGREDTQNRGYKIEEGAYDYINFEVKDGSIIHIKIYHEFP
ncbi:MAG: hypothetical protein WC996_05505 [Peptostreptococcales bacterium]|jgi:hypothetical protein